MLKFFGVVILAIVAWIVVRKVKSTGKDSQISSLVGGGELKQLFEAAQKGDASSLTKVLNTGFDVDARLFGKTALMVALDNGQSQIAKILLDKGIDVNIKDNKGLTALMYAGMNDNIEVAKLLLDKGADVNIKNNYSETALMHALIKENIEIVKLLLDRGANINVRDKNGKSALMYATEFKDKKLVELLRQYEKN